MKRIKHIFSIMLSIVMTMLFLITAFSNNVYAADYQSATWYQSSVNLTYGKFGNISVNASMGHVGKEQTGTCNGHYSGSHSYGYEAAYGNSLTVYIKHRDSGTTIWSGSYATINSISPSNNPGYWDKYIKNQYPQYANPGEVFTISAPSVGQWVTRQGYSSWYDGCSKPDDTSAYVTNSCKSITTYTFAPSFTSGNLMSVEYIHHLSTYSGCIDKP